MSQDLESLVSSFVGCKVCPSFNKTLGIIKRYKKAFIQHGVSGDIKKCEEMESQLLHLMGEHFEKDHNKWMKKEDEE